MGDSNSYFPLTILVMGVFLGSLTLRSEPHPPTPPSSHLGDLLPPHEEHPLTSGQHWARLLDSCEELHLGIGHRHVRLSGCGAPAQAVLGDRGCVGGDGARWQDLPGAPNSGRPSAHLKSDDLHESHLFSSGARPPQPLFAIGRHVQLMLDANGTRSSTRYQLARATSNVFVCLSLFVCCDHLLSF